VVGHEEEGDGCEDDAGVADEIWDEEEDVLVDSARGSVGGRRRRIACGVALGNLEVGGGTMIGVGW
jgi:hypothetical protein